MTNLLQRKYRVLLLKWEKTNSTNSKRYCVISTGNFTYKIDSGLITECRLYISFEFIKIEDRYFN